MAHRCLSASMGHTPTSIKSAIPRSCPASKASNYRISRMSREATKIRQPLSFGIMESPALLLSVVMKEGWNGLDLGDALRAESDKISSSLPLGVSLKKVTDQAVNISSAINEFMVKFAMAVGVVMLVSLLSLGWRVGIVVVAAIPLTL